MKIRIKGNSLRYRLTKTDIANFAKAGYLEEHTSFGPQKFRYALQKFTGADLTAQLDGGKITLLIPEPFVNEWQTTDRIGFQSNDNGLFILIEKDFVCIDNVLEDQSDNYPNPALVKC